MDSSCFSPAVDPSATWRFRCELRRWRLRRGLTQRNLANRVRFSRETVAAVEAGRRYGSRELAVRCDDVLGTGGLLTILWPQVAMEQIAADGRRGPRVPAEDDPGPNGPGDRQLTGRHSWEVTAAIDELRELIDQVLEDRQFSGRGIDGRRLDGRVLDAAAAVSGPLPHQPARPGPHGHTGARH